MTTAHRPTWAPAKGGEDTGGARFFAPSERRMAKDLRAQTKMKYRQDGQASKGELSARDLKLELEAKERAAARKRDGEVDEARGLLTAPPGPLDQPVPVLVPHAADADDSDEDASDASGSGSESDSDEDDTAALLAELERIKAERAEEAARKEAARNAAADIERAAELASGNPLLDLGGGGGGGPVDFSLKRSWHEETVFKNQARSEPAAKKRFINDTIRSDFHKRFLNRYVR